MVEAITTGGTLVSVQEQLHRALARLDQAGEHIASAHLLAAIDALEDRLKNTPPVAAESTPERPIDIIAKALVHRYGADAETVARAQLAVASGDAMMTWAHVVRHIGEGDQN